jgi:hypothetical protein
VGQGWLYSFAVGILCFDALVAQRYLVVAA